MDDSELRRTHVICENKSQIQIRDSYLWALHCLNETTVKVHNSQLCYLFLISGSNGFVEECDMIEILLYDDSIVNVSNTALRFIFYFDEGKANIKNCFYEDEIRFTPILSNLNVTVINSKGNPLSGAAVTLTQNNEEFIAFSLTNKKGLATFKNLSLGSYTIKINKEGYLERYIESSLVDENQSETIQISTLVKARSEKERITLLCIFTVSFLLIILILYKIWQKFMDVNTHRPSSIHKVPKWTNVR